MNLCLMICICNSMHKHQWKLGKHRIFFTLSLCLLFGVRFYLRLICSVWIIDMHLNFILENLHFDTYFYASTIIKILREKVFWQNHRFLLNGQKEKFQIRRHGFLSFSIWWFVLWICRLTMWMHMFCIKNAFVLPSCRRSVPEIFRTQNKYMLIFDDYYWFCCWVSNSKPKDHHHHHHHRSEPVKSFVFFFCVIHSLLISFRCFFYLRFDRIH